MYYVIEAQLARDDTHAHKHCTSTGMHVHVAAAKQGLQKYKTGLELARLLEDEDLSWLVRAAISDSGPTVCSHGCSLAAASGVQRPSCPRANRLVLRGGGRRQSGARNGDQAVGEVSAFRDYLLQTSLCRAAGHDRRIPPRGGPGAEQADSRAGKTTHTLQSTAPKERSHWTKKKQEKKPSCPTEGYLITPVRWRIGRNPMHL